LALSLSDIRTLVKENIHNDGSASDARINQWINLCQDDVERAFLSRALSVLGTPILTVTNQGEYTVIVDDFRAFIQFWQTDSPTKLAYVPYEEFVARIPDPSTGSTAKPRNWMFVRFTSGFPTIRLHPTPDAAYSIKFEYTANLPDLSNDADVSLISQLGWASVLINGATWRYYKIHSAQDSVLWQQAYKTDIRDFRSDLKQDIHTKRVMRDVISAQGFSVSDAFRFPENFPGIF
jgi:hypothetical protein